MAESFRGRKGIIIGGGASGLMAAITAAKQGADVTVLEHTARPGKKILSTGNGKCNLTNLYMDPSCYRSDQSGFETAAIRNFPPSAATAFFRELGVLTMDRGGYIYPMSGQAQTVLDALLRGADRAGVRIITECEVRNAKRQKDRFSVETDRGIYTGDFLILACGSMAAKGTGSDGSETVWTPDHQAAPGACPAEMRRKSPPESLRSPDGLPCGDPDRGRKDSGKRPGRTPDHGLRDLGHPGIPGEQVCGEAFGSEAEGVCSPELSAGSG